MKRLWNVLALVLLVNAMLVAGGVAWLAATGRLSRERVARTREVFHLTLSQEEKEKAESEKLAEEAKKKAMEAARLESVAANGAVSLSQRLNAEQRADELATQRVERLQRDIADLRNQLVQAKNLLAKQKADLDAERKVFMATVERQKKLQQDADFQQTVKTYEQLEPEQVKAMFQALLKENKTRDVLDYLSAMQLRKASNVLKEFTTPEEIVQATDLLQKLRDRGIDPPMAKPDLAKAPE